MSIDKKAILYWCDSVEKEFESLNTVIGGDKIVPKKFLDTSIQYLRALCEEKIVVRVNPKGVEGSVENKVPSNICPGCCYSDGRENHEDGTWICHRCGDSGENE